MDLSARLYLATAESCVLQLLVLFAVVYSQQMRKLKPKQTHRTPPQPQVLCCVHFSAFLYHLLLLVHEVCKYTVCLITATRFVTFQ